MLGITASGEHKSIRWSVLTMGSPESGKLDKSWRW